MGPTLGSVLAGIFTIQCERSLVLVLRYVDETTTFIKFGSAEYVLSILNSVRTNVKLTYKTKLIQI